MQDEYKLAMLLGKMIDLLRSDREGLDDERKVALRSLCELTGRRSWTVRLDAQGLAVEGVPAPSEIPFVDVLADRMQRQDVAEIQIAHNASGLDLLYLLRALAAKATASGQGEGVNQLLREALVRRVSVLTGEGRAEAAKRQTLRESDALRAVGALEDQPAPVQPPRSSELRVVPPIDGAAYDALVEQVKAGRIPLATAVKKMRDIEDADADLSKGLNAIAEGVVRAVRSNRVEEAIEAIVGVIQQEDDAPDEDTRRAYGVALRRMQGTEVLRPLAKLLLDPLYREDVMVIMVRAGSTATKLLLDLLVSAPTFAERRSFMSALSRVEEGMDSVVSMLNHHEWYVVRNVADLVAELGLEQAVPALGKVVEHEDGRVRRSVGLALAKIGTPTTARYLRTVLRDADPDIRLVVAKEIGGAGLGGLVMPLVNACDAEEDEAMKVKVANDDWHINFEVIIEDDVGNRVTVPAYRLASALGAEALRVGNQEVAFGDLWHTWLTGIRRVDRHQAENGHIGIYDAPGNPDLRHERQQHQETPR